jgi:hypothetical protein
MEKFNAASFNRKFRRTGTRTLIRKYPEYNSTYKAIARSELNKRHVPTRQLPYKRKTKSRSHSLFDAIIGR